MVQAGRGRSPGVRLCGRYPSILASPLSSKNCQLKFGTWYPQWQKILGQSSLFRVSLLFDRFRVTVGHFRKNVKKMS